MNYSEMTDTEIDRAVGAIVSRDGLTSTDFEGDVCIHEYGDTAEFKGICFGWKKFTPCKSWADAGPIITDNLITLKPKSLFVGGHTWFAFIEKDTALIRSSDKNPLRAVMIAFLMMREGV